MNTTDEKKKSQVQLKSSENAPFVIEDFLKQFRIHGISVIADLDKDDQAQIVNWAQNLVNQFGSILKENPMKIKNIVDLPCPKEDLKIAIKVLLPAYLTKGSDETVSLLKDRYVRLSAFQEISQEDKDTIIKEVNKIDPKSDSTETEFFPTYHKYMEIVVSEQKLLIDEIKIFINDLQIQKKDS